ncbi:unnamed protein product [Pylaiella littoralis]
MVVSRRTQSCSSSAVGEAVAVVTAGEPSPSSAGGGGGARPRPSRMNARGRRGGAEAINAVLLPLLLAVCAKGQEEEEGEGAADDEETPAAEEENDENAKLAKAVEQWLPMCLGLLLVVSVLAWCVVNVIRAARSQDEEEKEKAAADAALKASNRGAKELLPHHHHRGGQDTGDVSPDGGSGDTFDSASKRSRSGAALTGAGGAYHGDFYSNRNSGLHMIPAEVFKGDELRGKKAPGEHGNVYKNPMQNAKGTPPTSTPQSDRQESDLSRTLRPAVLRAARPISRVPSSSGVERPTAASKSHDHQATAGHR